MQCLTLARAIVRVMDPEWLREVYGFAPDAIFYVARRYRRLGDPDPAEWRLRLLRVGHGSAHGDDLYESFIRYQKWLLAEFDKMVEPNGFEIVDASNSREEVFETLRRRIDRVIARNGD